MRCRAALQLKVVAGCRMQVASAEFVLHEQLRHVRSVRRVVGDSSMLNEDATWRVVGGGRCRQQSRFACSKVH